MTYPEYSEYKDSGADWLGRVPAHWAIGRLKNSVASTKNGIWGDEPQGDANDWPCVRVADFDRHRMRTFLDDPTIRNVSASDRKGRVVQRGDLLLEKSGGGEKQPVGFVVLYEDGRPAIYANFIARMSLAHGMDPSFWRYVHAGIYSCGGNIPSIKQTSGIQNIDQDSYLNEVAGYPPYIEQKAIADFLDHETARIDALIEEQQRLIELLQEKRQAVISHAVTKGLDPDVPMKDSGVEWLGEVPEHWNVSQLRYKGRLESGHTPSRSNPEFWRDCTIPWFTLSDIWQVRYEGRRYVYETSEKVNEAGLRGSSARLLPAGSVILSRTASVGFPAILGEDMAVSQDFAVWVCGSEVDSEFLWYVLLGMRNELKRLMMGSTHQTIYMPDIKYLKAAFPPREEQKRIVGYLDSLANQLERLEGQATQGVELLKERRSALISAAVTGKIDVRNWQPGDKAEQPGYAMATEESAAYGASP